MRNSLAASRSNWLQLPGILVIALGLLSPRPVTAAEAQSTTNPIPLIVMDEVPLTDAIESLARMAEINYILDPRVPSRNAITMRLENRTAEAALSELLKKHSLTLAQNPDTAIARVTHATEQVHVVSCPDCKGTNAVEPLIVMSDVPLDQAILKIAERARLSVSIDKRITAPSSPQGQPSVSFRWKRVTARQALRALVDNYDLTMTESPGGTLSIEPKPKEP